MMAASGGAGSSVGRWSGIIAGPLAAGSYQVVGISISFARCEAARPGLMLALGLVAAAAIAGALVWSAFARREPQGEADRFVAGLSLLVGVFFLFVIALQIVASFLLPGCIA